MEAGGHRAVVVARLAKGPIAHFGDGRITVRGPLHGCAAAAQVVAKQPGQAVVKVRVLRYVSASGSLRMIVALLIEKQKQNRAPTFAFLVNDHRKNLPVPKKQVVEQRVKGQPPSRNQMKDPQKDRPTVSLEKRLCFPAHNNGNSRQSPEEKGERK